jgi:4-hydroxy-tetrahydrodipicolinate reductase
MDGERLRVAVVGARGRMGGFAVRLLRESPGFEVVAEIGAQDDLAAELVRSEATVGLDLTVAGRGYAHGVALLEAGVRPVIGTSGVGPEENAALDRLARARRLGGLVVPNFSIGMWCLQRAAALVARHLPSCAIVELHHERKRDAPSGTALDTAERLAGVLGVAPGAIPIRSVRLPGLAAHQEVLLGGTGETLTLRHDALGPEAYGPGILLALRHAERALGVGRGIGVALEREA